VADHLAIALYNIPSPLPPFSDIGTAEAARWIRLGASKKKKRHERAAFSLKAWTRFSKMQKTNSGNPLVARCLKQCREDAMGNATTRKAIRNRAAPMAGGC